MFSLTGAGVSHLCGDKVDKRPAGLVEVNRSPADTSEAESELIAGFHTEYSGIKFGFFYAAEYFATFALCGVIVTLFLGGWTLWGVEEWVPGFLIFLTKLYAVFFIFIWARGTLPRLRIDQLMAFAWKLALPVSFINLFLVATALFVAREYGWPQWTINVFIATASIVIVIAIGYTLTWRRERRLAEFRERWAQ